MHRIKKKNKKGLMVGYDDSTLNKKMWSQIHTKKNLCMGEKLKENIPKYQ